MARTVVEAAGERAALWRLVPFLTLALPGQGPPPPEPPDTPPGGHGWGGSRTRRYDPSRGGTLRLFFDQVHRPERLAGLHESAAGEALAAIRRLSAFLGRPAELADLSDATLKAFAAWSRARRRPATVHGHLCRLRSLRNHAAGVDRRPQGEPLEDGALWQFFCETYAPLKLAGAAAGTLKIYRDAIRIFSRFLGRPAALEDLSDDTLEGFLAAQVGRRAAATINKYRAHLLALWRYAWKKGKLADPPRLVERVAEPKRVPVAWSMEEMGRLLEAARRVPGEQCGIPARAWWPALILTVYDTGLRIGAALALPSAAFDPESGWLRVAWQTQKQKADQVFRLHPDTVAALATIRPHERRLLFGLACRGKWQGSVYLWGPLGDILRDAGLPDGCRDKFHKIRRTSATYLADAAGLAAAQEHLGHSSPAVTRTYIDPTKLTQRVNAADVMPRPTAGGEGGAR